MRLRGGLMAVGAAAAGTALLVACSDDDAPPRFEGEDAAVDAPSGRDAQQDLDAGGDAADARPNVDLVPEPVTCTTTPCATQIAAGEGYFCALLSDGTVSCWGTDVSGSLGTAGSDAGADAASGPVRIEGLSDVTQISARQSACALQKSGVVQCWGRNDYAQVGSAVDAEATPDSDPHPVPSAVALPERAVRVDVNDLYTCAVLASGKLACWGLNNLGLLARDGGSTPYFGAPDVAGLDPKVVRSTTGSALSDDGKVWTWGVVLGRDTSIAPGDPAFTPMAIPTLSRVSDIAGEAVTTIRRPEGHACAIANGEVYCWGSINRFGALCTGIGNAEPVPAFVSLPLPQGEYPQQLALTNTNTCVRATNGAVLCCGVDDRGQLGVGEITDGGPAHVYQGKPFSPTFVVAKALDGHAVQVAMGGGAACALLKSGEVKCWGDNRLGQLGGGTRDEAPHPTPVRVTFR